MIPTKLSLFTFLLSSFAIHCVWSRPPRRVPPEDDMNVLPPKDDKLLFKKGVIPMDKLMPDHLDAVRIEQDGHINKDFHKESFLGEHEEIDDDPPPVAENKLKEIFRKVDSNNDGYMDVDEMKKWIEVKITEHFDDAQKEHNNVFKHLDPDNKGYILWQEYYRHFLLAKGYPLKKPLQQIEEFDAINLKDEEHESLVRYKMRWSDADLNNDNNLSLEEFLHFRHPEQSNITMGNMVQTIINGLDADSDGKVTEVEFCALPPGEVEGEEQKKMDLEWQEERRQEFRRVVDKDGDGIATKDELMRYVDPRNPEQVRQEAENLLNMMDEDKDRKVSLEEVILNKDIFITSKVVDVRRALHDEF